ncbi:3-keto-5-aminohexanoate cleavage protein [Tateyamaria sp. SN6-1]|uniref:3-keto-5-aminohexanoate cleavage protein n=1 Tax=Tateyamaria sp. SN6-1 TaxID=3092148 RepID=UPI0039F482CC
MTRNTRIMVAPNGARLQKSDHPAVPISATELARTALECRAAGADALHLHVRDAQGGHSLDPDLYRAAIAAVEQAMPDMPIQITTEAAGRYDFGDQMRLLDALRPAAASIAIRETARAPDEAARFYARALHQGISIQHIAYGAPCLAQLARWFADQTVPAPMRDVILVLGQYAPPRAARPPNLAPLLRAARTADLRVTVCAFGPAEQDCLIEAARHGCDLRVGFENNLVSPDGSVWRTNADAVAALRATLDKAFGGCAA